MTKQRTLHQAIHATPDGEATATVPNHHAHHPPMKGIWGLVAAASMVRGRNLEAQLAAELAAVEAGDRVVDIGCGPGAAVREAARRGATAVGVDPSATMLRTARALSSGRRGLRYVEGTAEHLTLPDGEATVVWSIACVHHWADIAAGLAEVRRVLRPAGRFVAIERFVATGAHGLSSHGWTETQAHTFAAACEAAGFAALVIERRPGSRGEVLAVTATRP